MPGSWPNGNNKGCCHLLLNKLSAPTVGLIVAFSILAFIFSLWSWQHSRMFTEQQTYRDTVPNQYLTPNRHAHVLAGQTPTTFKLPNNLIEYIGGLYSISCASPVGHSIVIDNGLSNTAWNAAGNKVATCTQNAENAGILFRVVSQSSIHVLVSNDVVFT